jgi:putative tricarboxylic transport membrane protein
MRPVRRLGVTALLVALLALAGCSAGGADRQLRVMVPNSPGSGYDVTARTAVKIADTAGLVESAEVFNLSGGGGVLALSRLLHETGNPDLVMMMGLGVIGATVTAKSGAAVTDATPIARLLEEPEGIIVPAASRVRDIGDLLRAWKSRPDSFVVGGGSSVGGPDYLLAMQLAQAAGIDARQVTYQPYDGGGELLPAVLDQQVDFAVSGPREYAEQVRSGQLRVLAVSGGTRVPGIDAPTLTECGIDVVFANWRGVVAPPGITTADRDALIATFASLDEDAEWQAELTRNGWTDALLTGDRFGAFLAEQDREVTATLRELGVG